MTIGKLTAKSKKGQEDAGIKRAKGSGRAVDRQTRPQEINQKPQTLRREEKKTIDACWR